MFVGWRWIKRVDACCDEDGEEDCDDEDDENFSEVDHSAANVEGLYKCVGLLVRMQFVERWAEFMKNNPVEAWSNLQKELIDSQVENAERIKLTRGQVKYIKKCVKVLRSSSASKILIREKHLFFL